MPHIAPIEIYQLRACRYHRLHRFEVEVIDAHFIGAGPIGAVLNEGGPTAGSVSSNRYHNSVLSIPTGPGCAVPKNPAPDPPRCVPKPQSARRLWSTPALDFGECHVIEAARVLSVPVLLSCRFEPEGHRVNFRLAV